MRRSNYSRKNDNSNKIKQSIIRVDDKKNIATRTAATKAQDFFTDRFREQGWLDNSLSKWEKRKRKRKGNILVDTGALSNSIEIISNTKTRMEVASVGVPYASKHNQGIGVPQRQFIGDSNVLENRITETLMNIFKDAIIKKR